MVNETILWQPSRQMIEQSRVFSFMSKVSQKYNIHLSDFETLYNWSIREKELFWSELWEFCDVIGTKGSSILTNKSDMEKAVWFPEARLNFAENLLQPRGQKPALISKIENGAIRTISSDLLYQQVAAVAAWLRSIGVKKGDRVAGYLPNIPEAVVAMLATTSLGAVWTSTSPDFGTDSVIERFGQTEPIVLFGTDGYSYNGKTIETSEKLEQISKQLTFLKATVSIDMIGRNDSSFFTPWADIVVKKNDEKIMFEPCNFNDPLYVLYSSGTTGKPKCITHKVGGTLLQHLKEHQFHCDIRPGDRVFYFTTCGWMMWNWLASVLASRAAIILYDGSPFFPEMDTLWQYAEETGMTLFGTSPKYLDVLKKNNQEPGKRYDLGNMRTICSTGSVLSPESFDYVYEKIKKDVQLSSFSGGTDIVSCFIQGSPILPVYRGECQCRGLGMAVEVFDDSGQPVIDQKGELVCTATFPSQPAFFWGDKTGKQYHDAYFAVTKNTWHHGDYVKLTKHGGMIIYGRSDTTLNPGGVRIGTSEIYRYVEQLDDVLESIVIGQEWDNDTRLVLFVVLRPSVTLTSELEDRIKITLRKNCTPRHVPQKIIQVESIPRTKSGKIVELAVREVVHGRPVKNISALANPEALDQFTNISELQER